MEPRAHRRQFLVSSRDSAPPLPHWRTVELGGGNLLHHDPDLSLVVAQDAAGRPWTVLGHPMPTDRPATPLADLVATHAGSPAELYGAWAGRWLAVIEGTVHLDAGGLLACFYRLGPPDPSRRASRSTVSCASSPAFLAADGARGPGAAWRPVHRVEPDWYPMPASGVAGVHRLLPSETLRLADGRLGPRPLAATPTRRAQDPLTAVRAALEGAMRSVVEGGGDLKLPLTAGYDSRLVLAVAKAQGAPVSAFTLAHGRLTAADRDAAPRLAELAGIRHDFVAGGQPDPARVALLDEHTAGHLVDIDRVTIPSGFYDWTKPGMVLLRGGCFEAGRCFYERRLPGRMPAGPDGGRALVAAFRHPPDPFLATAFSEWLERTGKAPYGAGDWRDRFYIEQRVGGWASSVEQAFDLLPSRNALVANSMDFYASVLRLPKRVRRDSLHHVALIRSLAPELLQVPFNGDRRSLARRRASRVANKGLRAVRRLLGQAGLGKRATA